MLQNLLFSVNICLPLFTLLLLGYCLQRIGLFTPDYVDKTSSLVYYVLLPAKLFLDISEMDLSMAFDLKYVGVTTVGVCLQFLAAWLAGSIFCRERSKQGAFSHACYRGNFAYLGLALLQSIYHQSSIASTAVIIALVLPLYNVQGAILLTVKESRGKVHIGGILLNILKNPMVLAILVGLPFAIFHIELPFLVTKSLGYLESATSTMALLVVGASIQFGVIRKNLKLLLGASAMKLLVMPLLWMALAIPAGLTSEQIVTLAIVGAMPSAVNVYIITKKMGGDGEVACGAVVVSHLLSIFTLTVEIFILKSAGLI